jgi:autotransporter-associated beta strand protein
MLSTAQLSEGAGNGTVKFDGGTLRLTGNQSSLFAGFETGDVILANFGGTIDTQAFTVATAVGLTGIGSLTKQGSGTFTLSGANTYSGDTTIKAGTLAVASGGAINHTSADLTVGLNPGDTATLNISVNGSVSNRDSFIGNSVGFDPGSTGVVNVSGGTWGGCVYDPDRIIELLAAGIKATESR